MFYPLEQKSVRKKKLPLEHNEQCNTLEMWKDSGNSQCSIYSQELAEEAALLTNSESEQPSSLKLTQMRSLSFPITSQTFPYIETSETITVDEESLTSSGIHSLAQIRQLQETKLESTENIAACGLKLCESLKNAIQPSSSLRIPQDYSIAEWMKCFGGFPKAGTMQNGRLSQQPHLERHTVENGYLLSPTPNASSGTERSRPAGQTKCEKWFKDNGLLKDSQCLNQEIMALLQGFPMDWTQCLSELTEDRLDESAADICMGEQLCLDVLRSLYNESNISISASSAPEKLPLERDSHRSIAGKLPLEHIAESERAVELHDRLAELEKQRDSIRASGPQAPAGVWIEYGKISKRKFRQAYYRSSKPIFQPKGVNGLARSDCGLVKRQYIGEENSKAVKFASDAIARRNELERIRREIQLIERKL
jgi:hypothetical protein